MDKDKAYQEIQGLIDDMDEEVRPHLSYHTENMMYAQTKGILIFLQAMLSNGEVKDGR